MGFHFSPEMSQNIPQWGTGRLTKTAVGQIVKLIGHHLQIFQILFRANAFCNVAKDFVGTAISYPAGIALAAGFEPEEVQ